MLAGTRSLFTSLNMTATNDSLMPTPIPGAFIRLWIFPRAKKCPRDTFYTSLRTGAALSNPISPSKNDTTFVWWCRFLAEQQGFEPWRQLPSLRDFESRLFDHLSTAPYAPRYYISRKGKNQGFPLPFSQLQRKIPISILSRDGHPAVV